MDLRVIRFLTNLSQQALGQAVGIPQCKISSIERNFAFPSTKEMARINLFLKKERIDQNIIEFIEKKRNGNGKT